ncbi:MAG TPA: hypothetical protein VJ738_03265 [Steroidobacteraceae bacterium]|nr:hypothetical protein [Steroidobacteraceae bacterium]
MTRTQGICKSFSWIVVPTLLIACKPTLDDLTVWKTQLTSPDGQWVASARTIQNGGFGSADVYTAVYLKTPESNGSPIEVLGFDCQGRVPHPYVLDNAANRGGTIDLAMKWITPSHLLVTYKGQPDIQFQAVRLDGIEITLQKLASGGTDGQIRSLARGGP